MFTDMVGYTSLGQKNESLALALVETQRNLIRPVIARHQGREVKTIGDAFLVEFASAVEALRCAYDAQRTVKEFNLGIADEKRIHIRVGVHVGEVVEREGDILGDAVNVASRIEPLAEDGGVCVTQQVYDQVHNKVDFNFVSLGKRSLKNVDEKIEAYRVVMPWTKETQQEHSGKTSLDPRRVAILPFVNMSSNPEDEFFADGLTEELISTTSSIAGLTLIARTSVMRFKGASKGVEEIGRDLSAGTILEGSVRKAGSKLRVTVQLIDSQSQGHLWAQSYDRELDDVFAVQSDIARNVSDALRVRMLPGEASQIEKKKTKSPEAYTLYLKGRYFWNERSEESLNKAIEYFRQATKMDPEYSLAYSGMADCFIVLGNHRYLPYAEAYPKVKENAMKAVQFDNTSAEAHTSLGWALYAADYDWKGAERELRRAAELNPSYATCHQWYGVLLYYQGRLEESIREGLRAEELDPLSPQIPSFCALVYGGLGKFGLAEEQIRMALKSEPDFHPAHSNLRWVYLLEGKYDLAEKDAREFLRLGGDRPEDKGILAAIYALAGKREDARKILDEVGERMDNYDLILAQIGMGDHEKAIEVIQKEYQDHADWLGELAFVKFFESVRADDRVVRILKNIGLGN